jgi:apolipoprotein D and lipocalin family protein
MTGCVTVPRSPETVPTQLAANVDLDRYMGKWYIIANIPYFAEKGKVASYFDIKTDKGTLLDIYVGQDTFYSSPGTFTMRRLRRAEHRQCGAGGKRRCGRSISPI